MTGDRALVLDFGGRIRERDDRHTRAREVGALLGGP